VVRVREAEDHTSPGRQRDQRGRCRGNGRDKGTGAVSDTAIATTLDPRSIDPHVKVLDGAALPTARPSHLLADKDRSESWVGS
jgi:hypothetical protein